MSNTTNLNLFKHDNPSTNTDQFNIEKALNQNWDKVDTYAGNTNTTLSNKVDKVTGKGLSTNDYTNAEKQQVATNKTDIETLQAKNEALEEECEVLRNDLNNSTLTISGTGEDVTLENTAEARFKKLEVGGNSKQETTSTEQGDEYDSPSPEHPSEVQTITGNAKVVVCNKNIVTWTYYNSPSSDYQVMLVAEYHLKKGKKYIVSFDTPNTGAKAYTQSPSEASRLGYTTTYKQFALDGVRKSYVITAIDTGTFKANAGMLLSLNTSGNPTGYISNLMIESINDDNEEATEYTPHEHQNYVLPLGNMELCKIGDYKDYIYKQDNKWYLVKSFNKYIEELNNSWVATGTASGSEVNTKRWQINKVIADSFDVNGGSMNRNMYCNYFNRNLLGQMYGLDEVGYNLEANKLSIRLPVEIATTSTEVAQYFSQQEKPLTFYYQIAPTTIEITDTSLISVLNQIEKTAHSYSDITHIYSTDELSPIFDVGAVGDLNAILANQNQENS